MKKLLITGGRGGIGQAIAERFQQSDYQIVAPNSTQWDLRQPELIAAEIQKLPEVDAFIHCAGINVPKPFVDIESQDFTNTVTVNATSFYHITQALMQYEKLRTDGHILAISSIYGDISRKGRFSYTASKYCLNGMVKNLALELGEHGIKVNGLAPGFVETKMTRDNNPPETIEQMKRAIPLGHLADVSDIAKAAYFLASTDNRYIHGQIIIADGGYTVGGFQI
ncbi:MAG: SDR family oxidoreductase [Gammaproteobacteria bacterium]|nr:SDR family oxidoreductase [Gammaproteobacteria bacterium]